MKTGIFLVALAIALPLFSQDQALPEKTEEVVTDSGETIAKKPNVVVKKNKKLAKEDQQAEADETKDPESGDVYNFYFQKSPGTNNVQQGKEQKVEAKQPDEAKHIPKIPSKFDILLGVLVSPRVSGQGILLGADFNATKSWGVQLHLMSMAYQSPDESSSYFTASGSRESKTMRNTEGGSLAVSYLPYSDSSMRFSAQLGALVLNNKVTESTSTFGASGSNDNTRSNSMSVLLPFLGISGSYYISENTGINGFLKMPLDTYYAQIGLNFVWRL